VIATGSRDENKPLNPLLEQIFDMFLLYIDVIFGIAQDNAVTLCLGDIFDSLYEERKKGIENVRYNKTDNGTSLWPLLT
jgi:hypothetical protein